MNSRPAAATTNDPSARGPARSTAPGRCRNLAQTAAGGGPAAAGVAGDGLLPHAASAIAAVAARAVAARAVGARAALRNQLTRSIYASAGDMAGPRRPGQAVRKAPLKRLWSP